MQSIKIETNKQYIVRTRFPINVHMPNKANQSVKTWKDVHIIEWAYDLPGTKSEFNRHVKPSMNAWIGREQPKYLTVGPPTEGRYVYEFDDTLDLDTYDINNLVIMGKLYKISGRWYCSR